MLQNKRDGRSFRLYEAGAAILFFGILSQQTDLKQAGTAALAELAVQGYRIPNETAPVRVFPALTEAQFSTRHAGGWRPGSIYLRAEPEGGFDASVYLRHELFHEASFRSCGGRLPAWAEEAAAMRFSGELAGAELVPPSAIEMQDFKARVRQSKELDNSDRQLLRRLALNTVWPATPCALPAKLKEQLGSAFDRAGSRAYVLMSLPSARILESSGNLHSRQPPGSLLKIPYVAALRSADPETLGKELATSDTEKLLERREHYQHSYYRLLLSAIKENRLPAPHKPQHPQDWRALLGERSADGNFAVQADLEELALTMRAALLSQPEYFQGLTQNGILQGSTLAGQRAADKKVVRQMQAMVKTGSVSSANGQPQLGHLLVVWPASHPVFLAIFRRQGLRGAAILPWAAGILKKWQDDYPSDLATVRVRLLTLTPRNSWEATAECPELSGPGIRFTLCGQYRIVSAAPGSRSERQLNGVLHESTDHGPVVLETDIADYTDAVMAAEAQNLTGNARSAMRAVIAWNGSHGSHRHTDSDSLCDTTHCMVFLGKPPADKTTGNGKTNNELLKLLDRLAAANNLNWLPFANGGEQRWQRQIPAQTLQTVFKENWILDIRRELRKNGERFVHLYYPEHEETLSCEVFRNAVKLPSCPDLIKPVKDQDTWHFEGIGAGHGLGLSTLKAQAMAEHGYSAELILQDAYKRAENDQLPAPTDFDSLQ